MQHITPVCAPLIGISDVSILWQPKKKGTGDSIEKRSLMKCQQRQCSVSIK